MFQSLRQNSPLYIFHKGNSPKLDIGYVINQPITKPKYAVPPTIGQSQEYITDLVVKVNNETINYNSIPSNLDIADCYANGESIVISTNKDAINAEIVSLKQKSIDIIQSVDTHKQLIIDYDKLLSDLNPEYAEKKQQEQEISSLKQQVGDMNKQIGDVTIMVKELMDANNKLIEHIKQKET